MKVEAVAVTSFIHDRINAVEGKPILPWIEESLANDLERRGLVRIIPRRIDTALRQGAVVGKVMADGRGQPSSSSPPAQASPLPTLHLPKRGPGRPRKTEK